MQLAAFTNHRDQRLDRARQAAIPAIHKRKFTVKIHAFHSKKLYFPSLHLIARETLANDGNADVGCDEGLDHADAGQFHANAKAGAVRPEQLVQHLARIPGLRKDKRRGGTLVTAHVDDQRASQAREILQRSRSVDLVARRNAYREAGWSRFDEAAPAYTDEQVRRERQLYS